MWLNCVVWASDGVRLGQLTRVCLFLPLLAPLTHHMQVASLLVSILAWKSGRKWVVGGADMAKGGR